jgi:hypothetical protein
MDLLENRLPNSKLVWQYTYKRAKFTAPQSHSIRSKGVFMSLIKWLAAAMVVVAPAISQAVVIAPGSGWQQFAFDGNGSAWDTTFTVNLSSSAWLQVADGYMAGDRFEVFANGLSLGLTSQPSGFGDYTADFDAAIGDARWSSGRFLLGAGQYEITGIATLSPFGSGGGAVQIAPVPEPETYALMGAGLLVLVVRRRKSRKH